MKRSDPHLVRLTVRPELPGLALLEFEAADGHG